MVFYEEEIHRSIIIYADGNSISEMMDQQDPLEEFEMVESGYKGEAPLVNTLCNSCGHIHRPVSVRFQVGMGSYI